MLIEEFIGHLLAPLRVANISRYESDAVFDATVNVIMARILCIAALFTEPQCVDEQINAEGIVDSLFIVTRIG